MIPSRERQVREASSIKDWNPINNGKLIIYQLHGGIVTI